MCSCKCRALPRVKCWGSCTSSAGSLTLTTQRKCQTAGKTMRSLENRQDPGLVELLMCLWATWPEQLASGSSEGWRSRSSLCAEQPGASLFFHLQQEIQNQEDHPHVGAGWQRARLPPGVRAAQLALVLEDRSLLASRRRYRRSAEPRCYRGGCCCSQSSAGCSTPARAGG